MAGIIDPPELPKRLFCNPVELTENPLEVHPSGFTDFVHTLVHRTWHLPCPDLHRIVCHLSKNLVDGDNYHVDQASQHATISGLVSPIGIGPWSRFRETGPSQFFLVLWAQRDCVPDIQIREDLTDDEDLLVNPELDIPPIGELGERNQASTIPYHRSKQFGKILGEGVHCRQSLALVAGQLDVPHLTRLRTGCDICSSDRGSFATSEVPEKVVLFELGGPVK